MSGECRLSAFVVAKDESPNIERCLRSLQFCDEVVVVVDSSTKDDTAEIARRFTDRVMVEPWRGYAGQKAFALAACRGLWALSVDADEAVDDRLARALRERADAGPCHRHDLAGYRVRRRVCYLGKWIRFGSFGNDWVLRFFVRASGRISGDLVHEGVLIDGSAGRLPGILQHWSYRSESHHREKIEALADLWSSQEHTRGRRASRLDLAIRPGLRWLRLLVFELGFLNGRAGFQIAAMGAHYVRRKYEKLLAKENLQ